VGKRVILKKEKIEGEFCEKKKDFKRG